MGGNGMGDACAVALVEMLSTAPMLRTARLHSNQLGEWVPG